MTGLPESMLEANRWLLWRAVKRGGRVCKIPYYTNGKERGKGGELDSPEDIAQFDSYDNACLAIMRDESFAGLGFALGPDGTGLVWQGIDLDSVAENGLTALTNTLPGYVESSPSGEGVHAIGYGRPFKRLGANGKGIEAYSGKRYFTVTGKGKGGDIEDIAEHVEQVLSPLHSTGLHRGVDTQDTQESQDTHDTQDTHARRGGRESQATGGCRQAEQILANLEQDFESLPANCRPDKVGQRHDILFHVARRRKTDYPDSEETAHLPFVQKWHSTYLPVIGTKGWSETWADFRNAFRKVKYLEGEGPMMAAYQEAINMTKPIPESLVQLGYDEKLFRMVEFFRRLAMKSHDGETFYLGCRKLGELFELSHTAAGKILLMFVTDGILERIKVGRLQPGKGGISTDYRFRGIST